jgi:hypothetical protein
VIQILCTLPAGVYLHNSHCRDGAGLRYGINSVSADVWAEALNNPTIARLIADGVLAQVG